MLYDGFLSSDDESVLGGALTLGGASQTAVDVGTYAIVPGGYSSSVYAIQYVDGTAEILPATIAVTADDATREPEEPNPPFTASYSGFVNDETLATSGVTGSPSLTTAATATPVGTYPIVAALGSLSAVNNGFTFINGVLNVQVSNQAPICTTAYASPNRLWPPNHKRVDVISIKGVTDRDGTTPTITITYIWQDEPTDSMGDGAFNIDGWGVGTSTATVRRERQGTRANPFPGDGRVYEIGFTASDGVAECTGKVFVGVPHDQGGRSAPIDSIWRWDSTVANGPSLNGGPTFPVRPGAKALKTKAASTKSIRSASIKVPSTKSALKTKAQQTQAKKVAAQKAKAPKTKAPKTKGKK